MSIPRIRLSEEEYKLIQNLRGNVNLTEDRHAAVKEYCEENGIPFENVNYYWDKSERFSLNVKGDKAPTYFEIRDQIIKEMKAHAPFYPDLIRQNPLPADGHLLVIDPADVHIGKLATSFETGADYNSEVAVQRVMDGVDILMRRASAYAINKIVLIIGNDILHIDSPKRMTTSGTPQDTDGMWYESFLKAKKLYVSVIEKLVTMADIHVIYNPSNHDYMSGFFLADSISSWFSKHKNITFDSSIAHRKYFTYGNNLIGSTHGDGAKEGDLPLLMAHEAQDWSRCKHKYLYTHHLHHNKSKDYMGVNITILRSPSEADSWHHRNGYQHAPKAIEAFIHHPTLGRVATLTHIF